MKKKLFILFNCLSIGLWVSAQSAELSHMATSGGESSGSSMTLQWTLGELAATTQYTDESMLTEGFLQPYIKVIEVPNYLFDSQSAVRAEPLVIDIWPSPVTDHLNIKLEGESSKGVSLNMFDLSGRRVMTKNLDLELETNVLNIGAASPGEYVLKFTGLDGSHLKSFLIIKI